MARREYYTDPAAKHLEEFLNFGGGLNTETIDGKLADAEVPMIVNKDLEVRGSTNRRYGMVSHLAGQTGNGQGFFRYYKADGTHDSLQAIGGALFVNGVSKVSGLQTTRTMEAVQYRNVIYIATGSGLYQWDGTTMKLVEAYKPQPLEALYVGTNGLASDPNNYMVDGVSASVVSLLGVTFNKRYGVINESVTVTAYVNKPADSTVQYRFERKLAEEPVDKWVVDKDWSTEKSYSFTTDKAGEYEIKVMVRRWEAVESYYSVPKYVIKPTRDPKDEDISTSSIAQCNRIVLHWDRLMLYGDPEQPDVTYISHLKNPAYFPIPNSLQFSNPKLEGLTALVRFRDLIIAFTKTSIQALYGKSPLDYQRVTLNTAVGCIAPLSVKVFDNYVAFLSYDGVHILKSLGYSEDMANVTLISDRIQSQVYKDEDATAEVFDNQYHLTFPTRNVRLRYYYKQDVWVKDESTKFNFNRMYVYDGDLFAQSVTNGQVYKFDSTTYTDDGYVYEDCIESRFYDFGQIFNRKKIREIQLLTGAVKEQTTINVEVYIKDKNTTTITDSLVLEPTTGLPLTVKGLASDKHEMKVAGKGLIGKVVIRHNEAKPFHLLGVAFIFKLKKA